MLTAGSYIFIYAYIPSLLKLHKLVYTNTILGWTILLILRVDNSNLKPKFDFLVLECSSNIISRLQRKNRMIQNCKVWSIWEGDDGVSHVTFLHVTSSCSLSVPVCLALEIMWDLLFWKAAFVCLLEKLPSSTSFTVIFSLFFLSFHPSLSPLLSLFNT